MAAHEACAKYCHKEWHEKNLWQRAFYLADNKYTNLYSNILNKIKKLIAIYLNLGLVWARIFWVFPVQVSFVPKCQKRSQWTGEKSTFTLTPT